MIPDLTVKTRLGAVDLVPFLRRDEGQEGVVLREWERRPAVLALDERGWHAERIAHATGLRVAEVRDVLEGRETTPDPVVQQDKSLIRLRHMAERVLVDGRMVHPHAPHGQVSGYTHYGCRCLLCSGAQAAYKAETKRKRDARRAAFGHRIEAS